MTKLNGFGLGLAVLALVAAIVGFQGQDSKIGVVDFSGIIEKCDFYKQNSDQLEQMKAVREGLLEFLFTYKAATMEQATRLKELTVKDAPTAAEKTEMQQIKDAVMGSDKTWKELTLKSTHTADETQKLRELASRRQATDELIPRWQQEFEGELQSRYAKVRNDTIDRAREAINQVAKAQGYTVVLRSDVAPYGANDLTDAALKAMNAKK